jgi:hypothetical protein
MRQAVARIRLSALGPGSRPGSDLQVIFPVFLPAAAHWTRNGSLEFGRRNATSRVRRGRPLRRRGAGPALERAIPNLPLLRGPTMGRRKEEGGSGHGDWDGPEPAARNSSSSRAMQRLDLEVHECRQSYVADLPRCLRNGMRSHRHFILRCAAGAGRCTRPITVTHSCLKKYSKVANELKTCKHESCVSRKVMKLCSLQFFYLMPFRVLTKQFTLD